MSRCRFRLADMMPDKWFHKFKHMSSRRKHDPSPIFRKGSAASSLLHHHPSRPMLPTNDFDRPRRSYGGRSGRRRSVHRASSTTLGRRVASSSNQGHHSSPALVPPVTGTESSTYKHDLISVELDSDCDSVEIGYMDTGGGLSSSSSSSPYSNLLHEKISSSTMHLIIELDELHSTHTMAPEAKISDKEESCKIEHTHGRTLSRGNKGVKIGKMRKSGARTWKRFSSRSPTTSHVMVRFANKNIGESLAMVKSSYNPRKEFKESMAEMIMENKFRKQKDLEDLLAGYLSLNSMNNHSDIIEAFEQTCTKMSVLVL